MTPSNATATHAASDHLATGNARADGRFAPICSAKELLAADLDAADHADAFVALSLAEQQKYLNEREAAGDQPWDTLDS